jgi:phospholipid/cholesterol/gamma-HCH transport system substrate-binding protein
VLKKASTELKVGIFAAAIIAILAYATMKVTESSFMGTGGYELTVTLESVTGLKKKAPVELAGVPVGVIKKIELIDSNRARIIILVDKKVKLPANSKAILRTRGFLGETYVELIPGDPGAGYLEKGSEVISGGQTGDINTMVDQFNSIADDIKKITSSLAEIKEGEGQAPINRIVENLDEFTAAIKDLTIKNQDNINSLAENMAVVASELRALVTQGRENVEDSLEAIASITGKIDRGEGTVGKLINDDETVNKLNEAVDNLNDTLGGFRRMEMEVGYHNEYLIKSEDFKHYVHLNLKPSPDKAFKFALISDSNPRPTYVTQTTDVTVGGNTTSVDTTTAMVDHNKLLFSAQLAKSFYDFTVRGGIIESTGGVGMDYQLGPVGFHFDAFDFGLRKFGDRPHLKAGADVHVTRNFYLLGGADDFISPGQPVDWFVGAGFKLVDDDLKSMLSLGSLAR